MLEKPPAEREDADLDAVYRWLMVQRPDEDIGLFRLQSAGPAAAARAQGTARSLPAPAPAQT